MKSQPNRSSGRVTLWLAAVLPVPASSASATDCKRTRSGRAAVLLIALLASVLGLSAYGEARATAAPACPSSTTVTPGAQGSASSAVLYCGGVYTDTFDATGETDWIAFYTTQHNATVVVHYGTTKAPGITAALYDPGSSPGSTNYDAEGLPSENELQPHGLSHTFATPGIHYLRISPAGTGEGTGYQASLAGEWSQTPPTTPTIVNKVALPPPPPTPAIRTASFSSHSFTAKGGTKLRLTLSEAGSVLVTVSELFPGHKLYSRCSPHVKHGGHCSVSVRRTTLSLDGTKGSNALAFHVPQLKPGSYTATISLRNAAGLVSKSVVLGFGIMVPAHRNS
jgi:hypothetical protein